MNIKKTLALFTAVFSLLLSSCTPLVFIDSRYTEQENNVLPTNFSYNNDSNDRPLSMQSHSSIFTHSIIFEDGYIYYHDGDLLVRYNIETNKRTCVCIDPICRHDSERCSFYSYAASYYYNGKWYMKKHGQRDDGTYDYYSSYDPTTGTERIIIESETESQTSNGFDQVLFYENYMYYDSIVYTEATNDEPEKYTVVFYRIPLDGGTPESILKFDDRGLFFDHMMFADSGRIYFFDWSKGIYYILSDGSDGFAKHFFFETNDPSFITKLICCQFVENQLVIGELNVTSDGDAVATEFYKVAPDGTKTNIATVEGNIQTTCFTDEYIYFQKKEGERVIGHWQAQNPVNSGPLSLDIIKIYRMDYEGNIEKVFDGFPDDPPYETCEIGGSMTVIGDYLYVRYKCFGPEKKEVYYEGVDSSASLSGFLRLDIKTGEMIYVSGRN